MRKEACGGKGCIEDQSYLFGKHRRRLWRVGYDIQKHHRTDCTTILCIHYNALLIWSWGGRGFWVWVLLLVLGARSDFTLYVHTFQHGGTVEIQLLSYPNSYHIHLISC
jgi:hypothetical protein